MADLAEKLREAEKAIFALVKPAAPPPVHWLDSDVTESFCRECIIKERGKAFELGPPLRDTDFYQRTEMEDAFFEDIDGGYYGQSPSDTSEQCARCHCQLAYTLTDWGAENEATYWLETELRCFGPEAAYELERLFMAVSWIGDSEESQARARDVLSVAERVQSFLKDGRI